MLKGENINLRLIQSNDLDVLIEKESDMDLRGDYFPLRLQSEVTYKNTFNQNGFWTDDFGKMVIVSKDTDKILGIILFFKTTHYFDGYEIGYQLFDVASRGKGYMTEAVTIFAKYLFALKKINRLQLGIDPNNIPSIRVAEKCGFTSEGIARQSYYSHGKNHDTQIFSLLRDELPS